MRPNTAADFHAHVDRSAGELACWPWLGQIQHGYGRFRLGPKKRPAHRIAYELARGPIPPGLHLDHTCVNSTCCNPRHLEPVTPRENALRGGSTHGQRRTSCRNGHPFTPTNTQIDSIGKRRCLTCQRRRSREFAAAKRARERASA